LGIDKIEDLDENVHQHDRYASIYSEKLSLSALRPMKHTN
jgi:hypothetical protein